MKAINEASVHLELAERQAQALAHGELASPVLTETAPGKLGQSLQAAVHTLAASLSDGEEFKRLLAHEAAHDSLTGLANRKASLTHLQDGLARSCCSGTILAVLFVDVDHFKEVNDQFGHQTGDGVLCAVAERLVGAVRGDDFVGRLGGDEFLIIAEGLEASSQAVALAQRVRSQVRKPIEVGSTLVDIELSIGVALTDVDDVVRQVAGELLHDADLAVYRAKEVGQAGIRLCNDAMREEIAHTATVEKDLRDAIVNDELTLYYQPIVDAGDGRVVALEALVRWDRPGYGLIPPDEFIPIAEASDLIVDLDKWVIRNVVHQLDMWTSCGGLKDVPVAINVSGRHLGTDNFVTDILKPARELGVDPSRIVVEITESALLQDLDSAAIKLQLLRNEAIRIAIDDFGTGYTSLAHLRILPADILKIDRTFVADKTATHLVELIIQTGHLLGMSIIAEGVETVEEKTRLTELGSDELQGFLFSRPVPPADLEFSYSEGHTTAPGREVKSGSRL